MKRKLLAKALSATLISLPAIALANTDLVLEEVIVTAQKRAQNLQDVPISVNTISGDQLKNSGITNFEEMSNMVPNLNVAQTPGPAKVIIRGLGSGAGNPSFEQSVGLYVDGVYAARARQAQVPFMDVERVEVLRGPQGVLFGKNSIAGALSVTSAKPSDTFEGQIRGEYELEHGGYQAEAIFSGALSDNVYGRLAVRTAETGGYMDNVTRDEDQPINETDAVRATLVWDASDNTEVTLKLETASSEADGNPFELSGYDDSASLAFANPLEQALSGVLLPQIIASSEDFKHGDGDRHSNADEYEKLDSDGVTLQIKHELGEHEITYVAGYTEYENEQLLDQDFSVLNLITDITFEDYEQVSHELRISSPVGETFEYVAGLYYIDRQLDLDDSIRHLDIAAIAPFQPAPINGVDLSNSALNNYQEDSEAWSVFAQGTWNVNEDLRITLGARYTDESKEASVTNELFELNDLDTPVTNPFVLGTLAPFAGNIAFDGKRNETSLDPTLNVQWDFSDSGMAYLTWAKATKAGGFNAALATDEPESFEYEEEQAETFEIGAKLDLFEGRGRVNMAYFYTEFDDLQVSSFNGTNFVTSNAAAATSQGVELEGTYLVNESWTVGANMAWLDATYDEFIGPCPTNTSEWSSSCVSSSGVSQDLSGENLELAPEVSGTLYAQYETNLGDNWLFTTRAEAIYSDDYTYQPEQDSNNAQESFWKYNLRLAIDSTDERWSFALLGTNLSDEATKSAGGSSFGFPGSYYANYEAPRYVKLSATYRFGK
jgi:iron complex outermembrane recepter protein